jgi:pyridoxal/pyridoxine/pyridoxamine kinase
MLPTLNTFEMEMIAETCVFESVDDAKKAIKHLTTLQKRPVVIVNGSPQKYHIRCADFNCSFEISWNKREYGKAHVCKLVKGHECLSLLTGITAAVPWRHRHSQKHKSQQSFPFRTFLVLVARE